MFDREEFVDRIKTQGYAIIADVLTPEFVGRARHELGQALQADQAYHKGKPHRDYGMVLLCSLYGGSFIELFDNRRLIEPFNALLGDGCIVYAYTSSSMPPSGENYSARIHVDSPRLIPGYVTNMGATILLDEFTAENGATWFLSGSHTKADPPTEEEFYRDAQRLIAPPGTVFFFNARLWHTGGVNRTARWRHALTINMCRPYMKQRIDVPRAMSHMDLSHMSAVARQKLGFDAQVPASYDEYYAPPELRKFRQKNE
jgi:ectoine hydroxylase-related dioxygenase (phytanoyl-CoA dioxygenase family)